jgi:hypothetical protein
LKKEEKLMKVTNIPKMRQIQYTKDAKVTVERGAQSLKELMQSPFTEDGTQIEKSDEHP